MTKDNKYLELAVMAGAWAISSGDQDLLVPNPFQDIRTLTPEAHLQSVCKRV